MRSFWICVLFGLVPSSQGQPRQSTSRIVDMGALNYGQPTFFSRTEGWAIYATRALGKTNDGGVTWTAVVPPDIKNDATRDIDRAYFESASAAWVVTAPTPKPLLDEGRRLFRTLDAGRTWAEQDLPRTRWTEDSFFADVNSGSVWFGGQLNTESPTIPANIECPPRIRGMLEVPVIFYKGGGQSAWTRQSLPSQNGCPVTIIRFVNAQRGVAVSQNSIYYTDDAGSTWRKSQVKTLEAVESWHKAPVTGPSTLSFLEGSDRVAWLSYPEGAILKTVDGGEHWNQVVRIGDLGERAFGLGDWGALYFATEKVGWILEGDGEVFETRDGGSTWSKLDVPAHLQDLSGAGGACWVSGEDKLYRIEWR